MRKPCGGRRAAVVLVVVVAALRLSCGLSLLRLGRLGLSRRCRARIVFAPTAEQNPTEGAHQRPLPRRERRFESSGAVAARHSSRSSSGVSDAISIGPISLPCAPPDVQSSVVGVPTLRRGAARAQGCPHERGSGASANRVAAATSSGSRPERSAAESRATAAPPPPERVAAPSRTAVEAGTGSGFACLEECCSRLDAEAPPPARDRR
jgi:hypothetical protein